GPRPCSFLEQRTAVATQQPHRPVAAPQSESLRLVQRLVVALPRDLEDRVLTRGSDERIARERERLAELEAPRAGGGFRRRPRPRQVDAHGREATATRTRAPRARSSDPPCVPAARRRPRRRPARGP